MSALMTPAVSRWVISWPVPFTPEMAAERIAASLADGCALPLAIERLADGSFLGWLSVMRTDRRRGLLSYWLGEQHQGRGYMREALATVIPASFRLLDFDVLAAEAQVGNERSLSLLRGFGMVTIAEAMIFAPARGRREQCVVLELGRPA